MSSKTNYSKSINNFIFKPQQYLWFQWALLYFIMAGFLGLLMRYVHLGDLPEWIDYRNIRHAHSHLALLGWLYAGLYIFIVSIYRLDRPVYNIVYWLTQLSVLGMAIGFPTQGYKFFTIVCLSLFIFLTYYFIYLVYTDVKKRERDVSTIFLWTALFFLFLSSLGTWALAGLMASPLKGTAVYFGAIQFYLHFQFNGWLVFGVIAILFKLLTLNEIHLDAARVKTFYWMLLVSAFLTFAMSITWSTPLNYIFWINSVGVLVQLVALWLFVKLVRGFFLKLRMLVNKDVMYLLYISFISFVLKIIIQACVVIPYVATISYTIRNFVVGFIHLLMLGSISLFIIAIFQQVNLGGRNISKGIKLFILGIVLSEILLFSQGLFLWMGWGFIGYYYELLFAASVFMPLGLLAYFFRLGRYKRME